MTILFVTDRPPYPPVDGVAVKTFSLMRSLSKRHTVLLLSFCAGGAQTSDQLTVLRKFCAAVTFVPLPPPTRRSLVTGVQRVVMPYTCYTAPYQSEEFGIALQRLCSERPVEVIHFDMIYTASYLKYAPRNCACIASINDSMTLGFANEALRDASLPRLRKLSTARYQSDGALCLPRVRRGPRGRPRGSARIAHARRQSERCCDSERRRHGVFRPGRCACSDGCLPDWLPGRL